jgi:hypothetical protein
VEASSFAARLGKNQRKSMKYTHMLSYCQNKQNRRTKAVFLLFFFPSSAYYLAERTHRAESGQDEENYQ